MLNPNIVAGLVNEGLAALGAHDRVLVRIGSAFRDARARELGERLMVASVQTSIDTGRVREEPGNPATGITVVVGDGFGELRQGPTSVVLKDDTVVCSPSL